MMAKQQTKESTAPLVTGANGRTRKPRQGDAGRVQCGRCSTDDHQVYMGSVSTRQYFTYYRCAVCGATNKVAHYRSLRKLQREGPRPDFSAR